MMVQNGIKKKGACFSFILEMFYTGNMNGKTFLLHEMHNINAAFVMACWRDFIFFVQYKQLAQGKQGWIASYTYKQMYLNLKAKECS